MSESPLLDDIETFFAHTFEPTGPFGAKGLGEAAKNPAIAAFANAIYNAIGVRFYEVPITPEKVLAALAASTRTGTTAKSKEQVADETRGDLAPAGE
jgi:xanthine dehydrogenase molybdenum-binding subunit